MARKRSRSRGRKKSSSKKTARKKKGPGRKRAARKSPKRKPGKKKAAKKKAPKKERKKAPKSRFRPRVVSGRKIRVLVAKPGLDGHDRGAKVVAHGLRDAGMEVIYTGLRQTPEQIVETAIQEDVDVVGLSCLSGAHEALFPRIMSLLSEKGATDIMVVAGGIIPEDDVNDLKKLGIIEIFGPGTTLEDIARYIKNRVSRK
jgi:methylmalonyl-CoA mutase C-terminal domain/subunit